MKAAGIAPEKAIAFGRSIGSLYAIELAHRKPSIAGLILESGISDPSERFLKYADLAETGFTESELLVESKRYINHKTKLSGYTNPLLVMHTEYDGLIDISRAERNYRWAGSQQKRLLRFANGDHNSIIGKNWKEYMAAVESIIKTIENGAVTGP